jgi:hypothetical protein
MDQFKEYEQDTPWPGHTIRVGVASWAQGDRSKLSVKFTTQDCNGHITRSGEVPIEMLPQMVGVAHSYLLDASSTT